MKTKDLLIILVTVIIAPVLVYFIFSFVMWEFNPAMWGKGERCFSAFVAVLVQVMLISLFNCYRQIK